MNNPTPKQLHFPKPFAHEHPPVRDVNEVYEAQLTVGARAADWIANTMGSWTFIVVQSILLTFWIVLNVLAWVRHWDPYPFILMNLVLSMQAAYAAPIIMMSQNRQAAKDRLEAHNDFQINQKAEEEIRAILDHLAAQDQALTHMHQMLTEVQTRLEQIAPESNTHR
ncbi:MAG: DUF1003 domain-containing protein [Caldilineaceae bacterium]